MNKFTGFGSPPRLSTTPQRIQIHSLRNCGETATIKTGQGVYPISHKYTPASAATAEIEQYLTLAHRKASTHGCPKSRGHRSPAERWWKELHGVTVRPSSIRIALPRMHLSPRLSTTGLSRARCVTTRQFDSRKVHPYHYGQTQGLSSGVFRDHSRATPGQMPQKVVF